jgi:type I restriction enzyme, R subunit
VFVFVDECHRTQSGKLHRVMKAMMPNAVFIGFTGTPLLKKDKADQPGGLRRLHPHLQVQRGGGRRVVLDLVYEARDIDQRLGSQDKIDAWFEAKTKGLNDWQKDELKKRWGTMQNVLSSRRAWTGWSATSSSTSASSRACPASAATPSWWRPASTRPASISPVPEDAVFKGKCAVVTSYNPQAQDVTKEETGANTETDKQFIYNTYTELLEGCRRQARA